MLEAAVNALPAAQIVFGTKDRQMHGKGSFIDYSDQDIA